MKQAAPGVVFVHHFGGSARSWDDVTRRLGPGCRWTAVDLPGFGDAAGDAGPYDVAHYADVVAAAITALGADWTLVVGHSMGGKVALAVAARQPAQLAALLLLAPSPPTPEPMRPADRDAALAGWGNRDHAATTLDRITSRPLTSIQREHAIADMLRTAEPAWSAWLTHGSREDIAALMALVKLPVTILSGSADGVIPTAVLSRELIPRLQSARLVEVAGIGHLLPYEAPDIVANAVRVAIEARAAAEAPDPCCQ